MTMNIYFKTAMLCILVWTLAGCKIRSTGVAETQVASSKTDAPKVQPKDPFKGISAPTMQIEENPLPIQVGKYPLWVPTGEKIGGFGGICSESKLEPFYASVLKGQVDQRLLADIKKQCLTDHSRSFIPTTLLMHTIDYPIDQHQRVRKVRITLNNGTILRGILGLKGAPDKRPLVVIQCGFVCRVNNVSPEVIPALMHVLDESPYHVLLIGSNTGSEYMFDNQTIEFGGILEGQNLMRLAQYLLASNGPDKIAQYISSLHLLGVSLGGHASLFASILNGYNHQQSGDPYYKSVVALCPAMDIQQTTQHVFSQFLTKGYFSDKIWEQVIAAAKNGPFFRQVLALDPRPMGLALRDKMVEYAAANMHDLLQKNPAMEPFDNIQVESVGDYWAANNFHNYYHLIRTPTLIMPAKDDFVIPFAQNNDKLWQLNQKQLNKHIQTVQMDNGSHCGQSLAYDDYYGWRLLGQLIRKYVAHNSPEFDLQGIEQTQSLAEVEFPYSWRLDADETYFSYGWSASRGSDSLRLEMKIWSPSQEEDLLCHTMDPFSIGKNMTWRGCFRQASIDLPLSYFSAPPPQNKLEAQVLSRWANANVRLINAKEQLIDHVMTPITAVRWIKY